MMHRTFVSKMFKCTKPQTMMATATTTISSAVQQHQQGAVQYENLLTSNTECSMSNATLKSNPFQASWVELMATVPKKYNSAAAADAGSCQLKPWSSFNHGAPTASSSSSSAAATKSQTPHFAFHYDASTQAGLLTYQRIEYMTQCGTLPGRCHPSSKVWLVSRDDYVSYMEMHTQQTSSQYNPSSISSTSTSSSAHVEWAPEFELTD